MDLTIVDVTLLFENFQSSKCKLWEALRPYKPMHVAALLYILENLVLNRKCESVELHDLRVLNRHPTPKDFTLSEQTLKLNVSRPINANDSACVFNVMEHERRDSRIIKLNGMTMLDTKFTNMLELLELLKDERRMNLLSEPLSQHEYQLDMANRVISRTVLYNSTTPEWRKFLYYVMYQLFPDNLQLARYDNVSNISMTATSIVNKYLTFYKTMTQPDIFDTINSMDLKYMIIPKPRVCSRDELYHKDNHIIQPYYQGFYVVINASDTSIRVYNRWSERIVVSANIQKAISEAVNGLNCSLIAVIVPRDELGHLRSWRYWHYRSNCQVVILDILRYKSKSLVALPLVERLRYLENVRSAKSIRIVDSGRHIADYEKDYAESEIDLYSAIIGVVAKPMYARLSSRDNLVYRFPMKYTFDLMTNSVVSLLAYRGIEKDDSKPPPPTAATVNDGDPTQILETPPSARLFFNPELAQYQTTVMIYNHDSQWFYACRYSVNHHQFEHWCRFQRYDYDIDNEDDDAVKYAVSEKIMVLNSPLELTRGVFYLRIYYNDDREYLGYDRKFTASRYDVPLRYDFDDWPI